VYSQESLDHDPPFDNQDERDEHDDDGSSYYSDPNLEDGERIGTISISFNVLIKARLRAMS